MKSTDEASSSTIKNICLEFDMVSDPEHTRQIGQQYSGKMVIMYDRILQHRKNHKKNKSDTMEYQPECPCTKHERRSNAF